MFQIHRESGTFRRIDFKCDCPNADVILVHDIPEENLRAGDVGIVVEEHIVPNRETGYSVESFDMLGNTVAVVTLPGSWLRVPTRLDRPSVRPQVVAA